MERFFKKQVVACNALLHYLLAKPRDNDIIRSLTNPFPQSALAQLSFTNLSCPILSKISQVHCDFVLYFIVLMF